MNMLQRWVAAACLWLIAVAAFAFFAEFREGDQTVDRQLVPVRPAGLVLPLFRGARKQEMADGSGIEVSTILGIYARDHDHPEEALFLGIVLPVCLIGVGAVVALSSRRAG
jgi:hypothetical protein